MTNSDEIEMTAVLVRRADGWRIQFISDAGVAFEQKEPPFATQAEAQAALDQELTLIPGAKVMRAQ